MKKFLIPVPKYIPMIQLSESAINNLSYISVLLAVVIFFIGCYRINKKRTHGFKIIISSVLLLINPVINLLLG